MWVLQRELFAREEWIEMLRNQVLRPCADASLRMGLAEIYLELSSCSICSKIPHRYSFHVSFQLA